MQQAAILHDHVTIKRWLLSHTVFVGRRGSTTKFAAAGIGAYAAHSDVFELMLHFYAVQLP